MTSSTTANISLTLNFTNVTAYLGSVPMLRSLKEPKKKLLTEFMGLFVACVHMPPYCLRSTKKGGVETQKKS